MGPFNYYVTLFWPILTPPPLVTKSKCHTGPTPPPVEPPEASFGGGAGGLGGRRPPPANGRVTYDHCRVTDQQLFSKFFKIAWNVEKSCLTVGQLSRDLRQLSCDRSATFVQYFALFVESSEKFAWKPMKSRFNFRLFCFRDFCERLPHMLASKCLSRSIWFSIWLLSWTPSKFNIWGRSTIT